LREFRYCSPFFGGFALESVNSRKNAPKSALPRPAYRLTSAEASACRRAINLRRSFLGALGTLDRPEMVVKQCPKREVRSLRFFFTDRAHLRRAAGALHERDQGFAEPGALSSTSPADLPLPRTASRESFVLVASRARRSGNLRCRGGARKENRPRKGRKLRTRRSRANG
jgi:hypothetical protein